MTFTTHDVGTDIRTRCRISGECFEIVSDGTCGDQRDGVSDGLSTEKLGFLVSKHSDWDVAAVCRADGLTQTDVTNLNAVLGHEIAENTKRSYRAQWSRFVRWASRNRRYQVGYANQINAVLLQRCPRSLCQACFVRVRFPPMTHLSRSGKYETIVRADQHKRQSHPRKAGAETSWQW